MLGAVEVWVVGQELAFRALLTKDLTESKFIAGWFILASLWIDLYWGLKPSSWADLEELALSKL